MPIEKQRVYIETTIPSFYFETRTEHDMVARRDWTRQWWDTRREEYELVTSEVVFDELASGDYSSKEAAIGLLDGLPILSVDPVVADITEAYIVRFVMPRDPSADAVHLALASYFKCDFLLTWNCAHLANANKFEHIRQVNGILGLYVPSLVTPMGLLEVEAK